MRWGVQDKGGLWVWEFVSFGDQGMVVREFGSRKWGIQEMGICSAWELRRWGVCEFGSSGDGQFVSL